MSLEVTDLAARFDDLDDTDDLDDDNSTENKNQVELTKQNMGMTLGLKGIPRLWPFFVCSINIFVC